jgi:hypothetical protein
MNNTEILKQLYNDPKIGLTGLSKFKKNVKKLHPEISIKDIENFYKNIEVV